MPYVFFLFPIAGGIAAAVAWAWFRLVGKIIS
jgi:hypothetical protein